MPDRGPFVEVWDVENILDDAETQIFDDVCDLTIEFDTARYAMQVVRQIRRCVHMARTHCDLRGEKPDLTNSGK